MTDKVKRALDELVCFDNVDNLVEIKKYIEELEHINEMQKKALDAQDEVIAAYKDNYNQAKQTISHYQEALLRWTSENLNTWKQSGLQKELQTGSEQS